MRKERVVRLARFLHPSAWKFLGLIATDPNLDYLYEGQAKSARKRFDDPEPWLTRDANRYLIELIRPGMRVLEWGSGASTLWFIGAGCEVTSIEHDPVWFEQIACRVELPSQVIHRNLGKGYADVPRALAEFDVILIDGRQRVACAETVITAAQNGQLPSCWVIFDDSHRPAYRPAIMELDRLANHHLPMTGPTSHTIDKLTSIFEFRNIKRE